MSAGTHGEKHAVIVTGATSGIGAATARLLAGSGWSVVLAGRRHDLGAAMAAAIVAAGGDGMYVPTDITSTASVAALVVAAIAEHGRLDAVVNNAAVFHFGSVEETEEADWTRVLDTNVTGIYRVCREAIPHLRSAGGGVIVNVSSVHAVATMERVAAYAASKGAIVALSRQMALDCAADGIRVVPLVVGGVDTAMAHQHLGALGLTSEAAGFSADRRTIGRVGDPDEIARSIRFLLSDAASFMTGSPVVVDGGLLARL